MVPDRLLAEQGQDLVAGGDDVTDDPVEAVAARVGLDQAVFVGQLGGVGLEGVPGRRRSG